MAQLCFCHWNALCTCAVAHTTLLTFECTGVARRPRPSSRALTFLAHWVGGTILALQHALVATHSTPFTHTFTFFAIFLGHAIYADETTHVAETALPCRPCRTHTRVACL